MPTPFTPNETADVYHSTHSPPAAPDVAGLVLFLEERWENIKPGYLDQGGVTINHTHIAHFAIGMDVRDGDSLYVPDQNGTPFVVQFVARRGKGTGLDHKVAYLFRADTTKVPWPTDHL